MYGKLDNTAMYESIKPLIDGLSSVNSLMSNETAKNAYMRLMGPNFAESFLHFKVKTNPIGGKVKIKFGHRALQTLQVMPTVKVSQNGLNLENFRSDVEQD